MADDEKQPIIIKKVKKGGGGHHGGAWKVAYADFVTAMMAFFLLLWLLNVSTDMQKAELAAYFDDPTHPKVSDSKSGAGGTLGGISVSPIGNMSSNLQPPVAPPVQEQPKPSPMIPPPQMQPQQQQNNKQSEAQKKAENQRFEAVKKLLEETVKENTELNKLSDHIEIDITNEGLRIQIVDKEGESMFPLGSAKMLEKTEKILYAVGGVIKVMPNDLSIRGHTDGTPYRTGAVYTNWELSADRANASRRALLAAGVKRQKLANVMGKADTDLYVKDDPEAAQNRRISIVLLREEVKKANEALTEVTSDQMQSSFPPMSDDPDDPGYKKTEGKVYFP